MKKILTVAILPILMAFTGTTPTSTLTVEVDGYRNKKGQIAIGIYNFKNQYYDNPWKSHVEKKSSETNDVVSITLPNIPHAKYVITLLDDENSNGEMDYAWLGWPLEGYGFSNNQEPSIFGAPSYEDCQFEVKKDTTVKLSVQYWNK